MSDPVTTVPALHELRRRAAATRDLASLKRRERELWATGEYGAIARDMFWAVGARIIERLRVGPGDRVLDVACGTGNAALRAAEAGARVTGVDLTPELLDVAERLAEEAGVAVEWIEGDAEALPVPDAAFDVVVSTFGCMFAPRHEVAAAELARVLRPGGRIGLCSWTPDSSIADLMRALFRHVPPDPDAGQPPPLWGVEEHVRGLLEPHGIEVSAERATVQFRSPSVEDAVRLYETKWGPFVEARERLEAEGRYGRMRADMAEVLDRHNLAADGSLAYRGAYLAVVGRKA